MVALTHEVAREEFINVVDVKLNLIGICILQEENLALKHVFKSNVDIQVIDKVEKIYCNDYIFLVTQENHTVLVWSPHFDSSFYDIQIHSVCYTDSLFAAIDDKNSKFRQYLTF